MVASSPIALVLILSVNVAVGMAIGIVAGRLTAAATGKKWSELFRFWGICRNAGLGALAFVTVLVVLAFLPWPRNTITYELDETRVTSTMNRFQYPYRIACPFAVVVPAVYELYRSRRSRNVAVANEKRA